MLKNQRLTIALALALGSSHALGLGLGAIEVKSGLNQPLLADIAIVSAAPGEVEDLKVRLASPEAFARVGVQRPAVVAANLEFSVAKDDRGQPVIRVTTAGKVRDPFLNFLLEVEWKRGRVLREYTVLLDPPVISPMRVAPAATPPARQPTPAATPAPSLPPPAAPPEMAPVTPPAQTATPTPAAPTRTPPPAPATPRPTASTPAAAGSDRYGPVASGQTLWAVAQQVRPDAGLDTNQLMLGLLRANPDAFIGGNINRLKTGAVLRIPTRDEFAAIGAAEAAAQVRDQNQSWRDRVAPQPVEATSAPSRPATATTTRPTPSESRLEVVPPRGDTPAREAQSGASAAEGRELRADLARSREQVSTLEQENRELQSRVADLERIDGDTRRLLQLKDSQLAEAQRRLAELEAARSAAAASPAPAEPVTSAEPPPLDLTPSDPAPAEPDFGIDEPFAEGETGIDEALPTETYVAEPLPTRPSRPVPAAETPVTPPAPIAAQPWWRNPLVIGGAGALLLGLFAALLLSRRRKSADLPRRGVADAYAAAAAGAAARAEQGESPASDQAEERQLLDAIGEQPDDLGRHLALVRHYYDAGDAEGFEGAAEAMYAQLFDPEDAAWKQVVAMGRELLPDHPLFAVTEHEQDAFAASLQGGAADEGFEPAARSPAAEPEHVDWGLGAGGTEPAPATPGIGDTQRYSIDELDQLAREPAGSFDEPLDEPAGEGYDLDFGDTVQQPVPAAATVANRAQAAAAEPRDVVDTLDAETPDGDDAAATKLELARAYLDMGDVEGARGMLEEVVGEGNPGQRSEAKRLLDEIR
jgi:pilus assembly protein FimV